MQLMLKCIFKDGSFTFDIFRKRIQIKNTLFSSPFDRIMKEKCGRNSRFDSFDSNKLTTNGGKKMEKNDNRK